MATFTVGSVVLVPFPFSDLSQSKLRPAIVLTEVAFGDLILCQVTSNPYSDSLFVKLTDDSFENGSLHRTSYARPGKLFTGNQNIILRQVGKLNSKVTNTIIELVISIFQSRKTGSSL